MEKSGQEDEKQDKENRPSTSNIQKKKKDNKSKLSLKRTANKLTKEINKKIENQKGEGEVVFNVTKSDENYFVLEISGTRSFHKSEAAQEIT